MGPGWPQATRGARVCGTGACPNAMPPPHVSLPQEEGAQCPWLPPR